MNDLFLKAVILTILAIGLANTSVYNAGAEPFTPTVIPGNLPEIIKQEGIPPVPQPWEDGMRTDPNQATWEWWYFEAVLDDNSSAIVVFFTKPFMTASLPFTPFYSVTITTPNGTTLDSNVFVNTHQFNAARAFTNVTMGNSWVHGDLNTYTLHVKSNNGISADLTFTRQVPSSSLGGTGKWYFDPSYTQYFSWFIAMPYAKVEGTLTYNGQIHKVVGSGYHDHDWGTIDNNKYLDHWHWTRAHVGDYTVDAWLLTASALYNYQPMPYFYLAKGNQTLIEDMKYLTVQTADNRTAPNGVVYPGHLVFSWKNGTDSVNLTLTNPTIISNVNTAAITNATSIGVPHYMRFKGTGTLNVNIAGVNETGSAPEIWEINWAH